MEDFLILAFVFLIAGVVAVPVATKFGLGSVLGYLIAGIAISPVLAGLGVDVISLQHFAEFGVVMMLFLVGLELEPKLLWQMKTRLLGLGGMQVGVTALVVMVFAMALGQPWTIALAIGLVLALSSTAIVLQTLGEKGLMKSDGGQGSFQILLFQDIAVIPMLALIPLLAMPELMDLAGSAHTDGTAVEIAQGSSHDVAQTSGSSHDTGSNHEGGGINLTENMAGWQRALVTIAAIGAVVVGGSVLTRPIFHYIATARLRELFTATALMMVIGIALLMTMVGLSPALGTFLAGVVLANSEYRHELESDIDPFKGLLLGLFFMTVGAGINFALLFENFGPLILMTLGLMALKGAVIFVLARSFGVRGSDGWLMTLSLAQAGEFGFVLLSFSVANSVIPASLADQLLLVVALSMLLTPLLFILYDRLIVPRYAEGQARDADEIDEKGTVIIAGHGRFGGIVNRMLRMSGYKTVVLDFSSAQLDMLRTFGLRVFFGDATRPDMLHAAGIEEAEMLVVAIDDREGATQLVHYVNHTYPHVYIVARAMDRNHVYELYAAGCRDIIRDTFDSSVRAGKSALIALGMHPYEAERLSRDFVTNDREAMVKLASVYDPDIPAHQNAEYVARAKELIEWQEAALKGETTAFSSRTDKGWSPPTPADVRAEAEGG